MKPALLALLLLPWLAAPAAAADFVFRGRIGDVFVGVDGSDHPHRPVGRSIVPPPRIRGAPLVAHPSPFEDLAREQRAQRREHALPHRKHFLPHHGHHVPLIPYHSPYVVYDYDDDDDRDHESQAAAPPVPPEPRVAPEPPEPPDARGPLWETARGRDGAFEAEIALGRPLPRGVPHVALDWQDYDLPRPPAGQTYARVGSAVVLIEADSRVVRRILWPSPEG